MTIQSTILHLKNTIFELIFVLTSDNKWIGWFTVLAMIVDFAQVLSFGFHYNLGWGLNSFQSALQYTVIPWPVVPLSYFVVVAVTYVTLLSLLLLLYQVYQYGSVNNVRLLKVGRVTMIVCSTVLFFPILETFLYPLRVLSLTSAGPLTDGDLEKYHISDGYEILLSSLYYIISAVSLLIFYIPVMLFYSLYSVSDPTNKEDMTSKISTRPELLDVALRSMLVIIFSFDNDPVLKNAFYILAVSTSFGVHILYPYFVRRFFNYIRGAILASELWVGLIGASIASRSADIASQNPTIAYVTIGLMPVAASVGVVLVWWRMRSLDIRRFISLQEGELQVVRRCLVSTDVELATRSCLDYLDNADILFFAQRVFEEGLKKFPKSDYLLARYAIFLVFLIKPYYEKLEDPHHDVSSSNSLRQRKLMNQVQSAVRKMFMLNPKLDIQYFFFYVINLLEQQKAAEEAGVDKLHLLEAIRFKHDLRAARSHYEKAVETLIYFWSQLKSEEVSNTHLSAVADIFSEHIESATWYFTRLMQNFPSSNAVVETYKGFVRDVLGDERRANEIEAEAKKMAELKRQMDGSENQLSATGNSSGEVNLYKTLSRSLGRSTSSKSSKDRWLLPIKRVQASMISSLACAIITMCVMYGFFMISTHTSPSTEIGLIGDVRRLSHTVASKARQIEMALTFNMSTESISDLQKDLITESKKINNVVKSSRLNDAWTSDHVVNAWGISDKRMVVRDSYGVPSTFIGNTETMFSMFSSNTFSLGHTDLQTLRQYANDPPVTFQRGVPSKLLAHSQWAFIMDNGFVPVFDATWDLLDAQTNSNEAAIGGDRKELVILGVSLTCIVIIFALLSVVPSVRALLLNRARVYRLFHMMSKESVDDMVERYKKASKVIKTTGVPASRSFTSLSTMNSVGVDIMDVTSGKTLVTRNLTIWQQLNVLFVFWIIFFITLVSTMTYINYGVATQLYYSSAEVNYAGSRRSSSNRIFVLFQELIRADNSVWGNTTEIRSLLNQEITRLTYVHQSVKYGNDSLDLLGSVNRFDLQDALLFERTCSDNTFNCLGLDEMLSYFLQKCRTLMVVSESNLSWTNRDYLAIKAMVDGKLTEQLDLSKNLFVQETYPVLQKVSVIDAALFGSSFPILLGGMIVVYYFCHMTRRNIESTRLLLRLIPILYQVKIPAIGIYLKSSKLKADSSVIQAEEKEPTPKGMSEAKSDVTINATRIRFLDMAEINSENYESSPETARSSPRSSPKLNRKRSGQIE